MPSSPSALLLQWYDGCKRDLPWRKTRDPYRIWLSEIMLQQTRTETVKGYYARFLSLFPTVAALAAAPQEQVLKAWEGLGYYSRARNLQRAAQDIVEKHGGIFPSKYEDILALPGIGPYTAGAIGSIAFGLPVPAIDGNVYRVASRFFGVRDDVGHPSVQKHIRQLVAQSIPPERPGDYNQALMELGATLCCPGMPDCGRCPWHSQCDACREGDAPSLPIHEKKRPPKQVDVAVCLLTYNDQILVCRRKERMLGGLYVFWLIEDEASPQRTQALLNESGFSCCFAASLGEARHIFTHRVWNMHILHYRLESPPSQTALDGAEACMVTRAQLDALPFPSAMKAALCAARQLL